MKKVLIIFIAVLSFSLASAQKQVIVLMATDVALSEMKSDNTWGKWSDWIDLSAKITLDTENKMITVKTASEELFIINGDAEKYSNKDDIYFVYHCKDQSGAEVQIELMVHNNGTEKEIQALYIYFSAKARVYKVFRLG